MPRVRSLKTRSLYTLYKLLYERIEKKDQLPSICSEINLMELSGVISFYERLKLKEDFLEQKPGPGFHEEFFNNPRFNEGAIWWNINESYDPVNRKAFVLKLRELNKPWSIWIYQKAKSLINKYKSNEKA